jgi:aminopeptidase-like protein
MTSLLAAPRRKSSPCVGILDLTVDLCRYATGVVADDNTAFFSRIGEELPLRLHRFASGSEFNGWVVPQAWRVRKAELRRNDTVLFDGRCHPLAVATHSRSFTGEMDLEQLRRHLVTNPALPDALVYHCAWQYRPWDADWALCVPDRIAQTLTPGRYMVDLVTEHSPGEMLVATMDIPGDLPETLVFNAHTCHPRQANDDFAGVAVLVRLFQWLQSRPRRYSYRLVLGPEHVGTVHYLSQLSAAEIERLVGCVFVEMPGTPGAPLKAASTFLGGHKLDHAVEQAALQVGAALASVPWRCGAGNDETVWEAPGHEVPCVEISRCVQTFAPFPEYHSSLDTADRLDAHALDEMLSVLQAAVGVMEDDATMHRRFNGLICLSNPKYDLYRERPDPALKKQLASDAEDWGKLLDSLFRYFDGTMTILQVARRHGLPFDALRRYISAFQVKGLIELRHDVIQRPTTRRAEP